MLKSTHRLTTKQFMDVMKSGRIFTSPLFVVRAVVSTSGTPDSLVVSAVAPKKVASTAVMRNQIRRRIYNAVRSTGVFDGHVKSAHVIICAKPEMLAANQDSIEKDLVILFKKMGLSV